MRLRNPFAEDATPSDGLEERIERALRDVQHEGPTFDQALSARSQLLETLTEPKRAPRGVPNWRGLSIAAGAVIAPLLVIGVALALTMPGASSSGVPPVGTHPAMLQMTPASAPSEPASRTPAPAQPTAPAATAGLPAVPTLPALRGCGPFMAPRPDSPTAANGQQGCESVISQSPTRPPKRHGNPHSR